MEYKGYRVGDRIRINKEVCEKESKHWYGDVINFMKTSDVCTITKTEMIGHHVRVKLKEDPYNCWWRPAELILVRSNMLPDDLFEL